ncbi:MAG: hypothetical protein ACK5VJ_00280 [Pseudomonadota bacterium]
MHPQPYLLGGRLKANPVGVRFNFLQSGGIDIRSANYRPTMVKGQSRAKGPTITVGQTEKTLALAKKRARAEAESLASLTRKGKSGDGGGKGGQKKGKGNK